MDFGCACNLAVAREPPNPKSQSINHKQRGLSFRFQVSDFGFRLSAFGFWISGFGFRVSGFGSQLSDFGLRGCNLYRHLEIARKGRLFEDLCCLPFGVRVLGLGCIETSRFDTTSCEGCCRVLGSDEGARFRVKSRVHGLD